MNKTNGVWGVCGKFVAIVIYFVLTKIRKIRGLTEHSPLLDRWAGSASFTLPPVVHNAEAQVGSEVRSMHQSTSAIPTDSIVLTFLALTVTCCISLIHPPLCPAQTPATEKFVFSFGASGDASSPSAALIRDPKGNLYGTALGGIGEIGYGSIFAISPTGVERVLYSFTNGTDGTNPVGALVRDTQGNLYGAAASGGQFVIYGTIFRLAADGRFTVLHAFQGSPDGSDPTGSLVRDSAGNLYGTTRGGGSCCGTVFKLAPDGTLTILYNFIQLGNSGFEPHAGLTPDAQGNLYGTTVYGGGNGGGTVFKITPSGQFSVLYSFHSSGGDPSFPEAVLLRDSQGSLYGTSSQGGTLGAGSVFKIAPDGTESVLYSFTGLTDGHAPLSSLIRDSQGNLYGTTSGGGGGVSCAGNCGVVFRITPAGNENVIYQFGGRPDGGIPRAGLLPDGKGGAFGTTTTGGTNGTGTVYWLRP